MFNLILFEPEIPPNTGNVIRLCANTGIGLHLIEPLGFDLDDKRLRRAGLDYREYASVAVHPGLEECLQDLGSPRLFALSTRGGTRYDRVQYRLGDALILGPETRGLPAAVLQSVPPGQRLRIPMREGSRSLNLSNAAAVVAFEAWRQSGFAGGL
ncbi:MAG: tRNA (uridine(34)/cytosine(34)/5-carboxymethylaminomethyluridine(34)-2'-O)-methyltransferase TrmL [Chromatiales bacterium]|nr:MAG: tRNA (uridine(34)/cytosine(34)/5-carboxymethylaminomethyluridine(34)-2'-O)-methyltransferase TrmL [Chromatiales bacterium]